MNYNLNQQYAIESLENNIIIKAPPGSGKTATLIGAIQAHRERFPKDKIVAITFTRKAAGELQNRIQAMNVEISTIHSWAYRRLQALGGEYGFSVNLLEEDVIKEILKMLSKKRRQYYLNQFQLYSYVMGNYNIDIDDRLKRIFDTIHSDYIKYKRQNHFYDFTDLPQYLYDKLIDYDERIVDIDALFVDEFQDVDNTQLEIFNLVDAQKKVFIGDPQQSIYQFRGALGEAFEQLSDFNEYNLDINYRSYQEILDYADTFYTKAEEVIKCNGIIELNEVDTLSKSKVICERGYGAELYIIDELGSCYNMINNSQCSESIVLKRLILDRHTQILCRSNRQVKKLQAQGIENVSTIHQAKGLEYANVILVNFPVNTDEEKNIAYVGATRAKNILCVADFDVLMCVICRDNIRTTNQLF